MVPSDILTHVVPPTLEEVQPVWKPMVMPPTAVVPVMLKIAVNRSPVNPLGDVPLPKPTMETCIVSGVSVVWLHVDPDLRAPPTHSTSIVGPGMAVPDKSTSNGLSIEMSLIFRVISAPFMGLVLLTHTGTRSKVLGDVTGPLKVNVAPVHLVSVGCGMQTRPPVTARPLGII